MVSPYSQEHPKILSGLHGTPKGHLNQTQNNVHSTKPKPLPFEEVYSPHLHGCNAQDVYTNIYHVQDTIFSNQTGQFPLCLQSGNKYIMVMVEIDSSTILVEPIKNRTNTKLTHNYSMLMLCLKRAGVKLHKHILDNEISTAMKDLIKDTYKITLELVPPSCHHHNDTKVAIHNFKLHFFSFLAGTADNFLLCLWDKLFPQAEPSISYVNLMPLLRSWPMLTSMAPLTTTK
ncbi:hypothetical protein ACHAW6_000140, partial [Cyclotella cf. meneghiniana]